MVPYSILISYCFCFFYEKKKKGLLSELTDKPLPPSDFRRTAIQERGSRRGARNTTHTHFAFTLQMTRKKKEANKSFFFFLNQYETRFRSRFSGTRLSHTPLFLVLLTPDIPLSTLMSVKQNTISLPCFFVHRTVFGFF